MKYATLLSFDCLGGHVLVYLNVTHNLWKVWLMWGLCQGGLKIHHGENKNLPLTALLDEDSRTRVLQ